MFKLSTIKFAYLNFLLGPIQIQIYLYDLNLKYFLYLRDIRENI